MVSSNDSQTAAPSSDPGTVLVDHIRHRLTGLNSGGGFGKAIDSLFNSDGKFEEAERERIVSYAVRRIIHGVQYVIDEQAGEDRSPGRLMSLIEYYLLRNTNLTADDDDLERLKALILAVIGNAKKSVSRGTKRKVLDSCRQNEDSRCYICGVDLDFLDSSLKRNVWDWQKARA